MPQMLLPDARGRSPTAIDGKSALRDDQVYSSIVAAYGGSGVTKAFTVPQGQNIPQLKGSAITVSATHQLIHTELTTNLTKAGEAGSSIGDFSVRRIGIDFEQAYYTPSGGTAGVQNAYGAGQQEMAELLAKTWFQLKIAGTKQQEGATRMFGSAGGMTGSISNTGNATVVAAPSNGNPGNMRVLQTPILVGRTDTIEGVFGVAGSASLAFSTASGQGNSTLVWFTLRSDIAADVRG